MRPFITVLMFLGVLGPFLARIDTVVRWCTISRNEAQKCFMWQEMLNKAGVPKLRCARKYFMPHCIQEIMMRRADAMTLSGSAIFDFYFPYKLQPIAAEVYGTKEKPRIHYYAVAVVKNSSDIRLNQLQGLKSCHAGFDTSAGWIAPLGALRPYLNWDEKSVSLEEAVSKFFSQSCVPGISKSRFPRLCSLCAGKGEHICDFSPQEPYAGYAGAFRCLRDNAGDVAFIRESTIFEELPNEAEWDQYKLLCPDNTWKPVTEYKECHLAQIPSRAVVAHVRSEKDSAIWELLHLSQEMFGKNKTSKFELFGSYLGQKDLLFKDSVIGFVRVPFTVNVWLYLTFSYIMALKSLKESKENVMALRARITWCAVGSEEKLKCDQWSRVSVGKITCISCTTTEQCIFSITMGDADAMNLDGGYIYSAGKCGLVPVLAEIQKSPNSNGSDCVDRPAEGYLAVAAVRKEDTGFTWSTVRGKKSCHTAVDRTAGWNIPMGLLVNQTNSCQFKEFFNKSCAPGSFLYSNLCALCIGDENGKDKCNPNSQERYQGYVGAFRCLAEKAGNVAFLKDATVLQNTDGKNADKWAKNLKLDDFELLCLDDTRKPVTEAKNCHLAVAPNHAVVARKDKARLVQQELLYQQVQFGRNGCRCPEEFCLFRSETKNLLFNDNTECLAKLPSKITWEEYLGKEYVVAIAHLRQCSNITQEAYNFLALRNS
ncbi:lactotransferrin (predicted) [Rattus norvegicus]|uniref:Lactotransferrin n=2 Tax=Rattus norvegicus TaxID=10116 RepID=A6I3I7_RAT|nr:lactotransferrin precursor [Rattus norvegicus]EDL77040.1 lactotransferrin (predicted) [Rattus norvegicus]|eukprot:NP_001100334.1 lactotransferrin precursor [Rattus norvegicus]